MSERYEVVIHYLSPNKLGGPPVVQEFFCCFDSQQKAVDWITELRGSPGLYVGVSLIPLSAFIRIDLQRSSIK